MGTGNGLIKRVYVPYQKWEEHKNGMWKSLNKDDFDLLPKVIEFTGNHIEYGKAMIKVLEYWNFSCLDKLSNKNINRKAWIGHAACCFKFGWKERLVRIAWKELTQNQRDLANKEAEKAISYWELFQVQKKQLNQLHIFSEEKNREIHQRMGIKML